MEISEYKEKKVELEEHISNLILKFQMETDVIVKDVYVDCNKFAYIPGGYSSPVVSIESDI